MDVKSVWIDASFMATGVVVESGESHIEDACWLRPAREDKYINLVKLDAMLRGINLTLQWKAIVLHLKTDSACVHLWISDALSGKARIHTKAASKMGFTACIQFLLMESHGISETSAHGTDQLHRKTTAVIVHLKVTRTCRWYKAR